MFPNTNTLIALANLKKIGGKNLDVVYSDTNRVSGEGLSFEYFVKDLYCNSFNIDDFDEKTTVHENFLSYKGATNNPPDFIIKGSDAAEVKKVGSYGSQIQLNSSKPKSKLLSTNERIKEDCLHCEDDIGGWDEKDLIYIIGTVKDYILENIWFLYGDCYAARNEIYTNLTNSIEEHIDQLGENMSDTNELGRLNYVDPLQISSLRIRGMWIMLNPSNVYGYAIEDMESTPVISIMRESKFESMVRNTPDEVYKYIEGSYTIQKIGLRNPNNPMERISSVIIRGTYD